LVPILSTSQLGVGAMCKLLVRALLILTIIFSSQSKAETLNFVISASDPPISSAINGEAVGLFPDLVKLVFSFVPQFNVAIKSFPWVRAQALVENGLVDGFMTYPSDKRKRYAGFSNSAVYTQDYGYLIYHKANPNRLTLEESKSFQDIANLKVILESGSEWERDNIPKFLRSIIARNQDTKLNLLLLRREGDFLVMPPENAKYIARKFGYEYDIAYHPVRYINDSLIPFHIGLSHKYKRLNEVIELVDAVLTDSEFQTQRQKIIDRYR